MTQAIKPLVTTTGQASIIKPYAVNSAQPIKFSTRSLTMSFIVNDTATMIDAAYPKISTILISII
ncbi:Uncharacterised protein [Vibrio cholerae]|nr:Uncharacterised protein [Vibrio cholerae]